MRYTLNSKKGKRTMTRHMLFALELIEEAMEMQTGFCIKCGAERECCEPDARGYDCEVCGENDVYGAEELVLMGLVR
jgi:hypothetical protein